MVIHYKICKKCGENKDLSEFSKNAIKKDGLQIYCKSCKKIYGKDHYNKNKDKYFRKNKVNKKKVRKILSEYKESFPCTDCKNYFPYYVMDFDHVNGIKLDNVARFINDGRTNKAKEEMLKCELVCANCHRIRTYKRRQI